MRARARAALPVAAAAVAAFAGAVAFAVVVPPYQSADEAAHVDHALRVWHGELPRFEDGLRLRIDEGVVPPRQWTSHHPPLYYLLIAPVVGPLVDAGHPVDAVVAVRLVHAVLAALLVVASAWAARWILPERAPALVVPVLVAAAVWVQRLGGAAYNDVLFVLLTTLLLGATARLVRAGPPRGRALVPWLLLPALLALTRAHALPLIALCLAVAAATLLLDRRRDVRSWLLVVVAPPALTVAAAGWFYLRNLRETGSWVGSQPEYAASALGRRESSVTEVVTDGRLLALLDQFAFSAALRPWANLVLFLLPAVVGAVVLVGRALRSPTRRADLTVVALLLCAVGGVVVQQVLYTAGGGGANARYLAPLVVVFAALVASGLAATRVLWVAVSCWCVLRCVDLVLDLREADERFGGLDVARLPPTLLWPAVAVVVLALATAVLTGGTLRRDPPAASPAAPSSGP